MAISGRAERAGGRDIVNAALSKRLHRAGHLSALRGSPQTGTPLPVYLLGHVKASLTDPLSAAKMIGWRYPIVGGASPGLACLHTDSSGFKFAGMIHGPLAARLFEAATLADEKLGSLKQKFEPRLLEVPSLRICALWLRRSKRTNRFFFLMDGQLSTSSPLNMERGIQRRLKAALAVSRARSRVARTATSKKRNKKEK